MARVVMATVMVVAFGLSIGRDAKARDPRVVASITPIHALVAGVMEGAGQPALLVKSGASPHTYSLRPSEARVLQQADIVFWVGEDLETFLEKPLKALPHQARVVGLHEAPGITLLPYRAGGSWESHTPDRNPEHGDQAPVGREADHAPGKTDMHVWLDPVNAKVMVAAIAASLSAADPDRAALYWNNSESLQARLEALDRDLKTELASVANRPYIVFHDAYQYFEKRYGLMSVGSIAVSPERQPSAQRIWEIHDKIVRLGAACVFREPQFEPVLVKTVIEGTRARTGMLDADGGVGVPPGPDAYFTLMHNLARSLTGCLAPAG